MNKTKFQELRKLVEEHPASCGKLISEVIRKDILPIIKHRVIDAAGGQPNRS